MRVRAIEYKSALMRMENHEISHIYWALMRSEGYDHMTAGKAQKALLKKFKTLDRQVNELPENVVRLNDQN